MTLQEQLDLRRRALDAVNLLPIAQSASRAAGAAAAGQMLSVRVNVTGSGHSVSLTFDGPGSAVAKRAAQDYLAAQGVDKTVRDQMVRAL